MPCKDRARRLQYDRDYCKIPRNRARARERRRLPRYKKWRRGHDASLKGGYTLLRRIAVRRQCEMAISFGEYCELIIGKPCAYCKADISKRRGHKLDRVDNQFGYFVDNVVPCCADCNRIKGVLERWGYRLPQLLETLDLVRKGKFCTRGHKMSGANLLITKRGDRVCLTCKRKSSRDIM